MFGCLGRREKGGEERRNLESRKWEVKMRGIGLVFNRFGEFVKRFFFF